MISVFVQDFILKFGQLEVFSEFNLFVEEGEFLVFFGFLGCGKFILFNCIVGLFDIIDGQIYIFGKNVIWEEFKDCGIGMVFQFYVFYLQMMVEKNFFFGLQIVGVLKVEILEWINWVVEILQIEFLLKCKFS